MGVGLVIALSLQLSTLPFFQPHFWRQTVCIFFSVLTFAAALREHKYQTNSDSSARYPCSRWKHHLRSVCCRLPQLLTLSSATPRMMKVWRQNAGWWQERRDHGGGWWWRRSWNKVVERREGKECACKVLKDTAHEGNAGERLLGAWSGRLNAKRGWLQMCVFF